MLAALTLFAAKRLPAVVEIVLRSRTSVSPGARYTTSTMLNYLIIGTGIIAGLSALGLQWGQLQWLVAALGVGIGFGLQEIVANFISGLIILFERPIRVGDIITIGPNDGIVKKIRIRATTLQDWDGKELLVPNKEFITGRLLNWTLSDSSTRLVIPVGVAYGSDVDKAIELLEQVLDRHPKVLEDPSSSVLFLGFGDNSLNLVARAYVGSTDTDAGNFRTAQADQYCVQRGWYRHCVPAAGHSSGLGEASENCTSIRHGKPGETIMNDEQAVRTTIQTYFDCMFESSSAKTHEAFHPNAKITGVLNGDLQEMSVNDFAGFVAAQQPSPKEKGEVARLDVVSLDITGDTAVARVRDDYLGMTFLDTLSFLKTGESWQIYNKLFYVEGSAD